MLPEMIIYIFFACICTFLLLLMTFFLSKYFNLLVVIVYIYLDKYINSKLYITLVDYIMNVLNSSKNV